MCLYQGLWGSGKSKDKGLAPEKETQKKKRDRTLPFQKREKPCSSPENLSLLGKNDRGAGEDARDPERNW